MRQFRILIIIVLVIIGTSCKEENPFSADGFNRGEFSNYGMHNEHGYVDLGLSVMWATCNVGASSFEEYGDYYAWGEIETKSEFTSATYSNRINSNAVLFGADVAVIKWGGEWRIPTKLEIQELMDPKNCTWTWGTLNYVPGYKITSKINGKSIFLPAAGSIEGTTLYDDGTKGCYWTSTLNFDYDWRAYYLGFNSKYDECYDGDRIYGRSIRPVFKSKFE